MATIAPATGPSTKNSTIASRIAMPSTAQGNHRYCLSKLRIASGALLGITEPTASSTVTTPLGTVFGGALVTWPAFIRWMRLAGVAVAVNGSERISRAFGRRTRRIAVEVSVGGTSVGAATDPRKLATVVPAISTRL